MAQPHESAPRISVVIAAYRPGEGFDRVMRSLDAQTLPQDQFETIVVDDGSPDDTFERISRLASSRPNMRVERIENSGWPSRPRNVATGIARGEYVLYMDHDDSLYPDALRRMAEYAAETRADVLSPKESKTSDAWWCMPALVDGNVANAVTDGGIDRLLPMVPHKLYRRAFLDEHGIRFPEGRRQLWEDIYLNVEAWRHAERVAVLADTPAYLWWSSRSNNSKTYGPRTEEFWDRLDELFAFIDETLAGPAHEAARKAALLHQYRGRVLTRLSRNLRGSSGAEAEMAMRRARAIQTRYVPEEWDDDLGPQPRARALLLRQERPDLLMDLWTADANTAARVVARSARWEAGVLHLELEAQWLDKAGKRVALRRVDGRVQRDLSPRLLAALPAAVTDFTDTLQEFRVDLGVRDRFGHVTWQVPTVGAATWEQFEDGRVAPRLTAHAVIDPRTAALGAPLAAGVHDLIADVRWASATRGGAVQYDGPAQPAVLGPLPAVAYKTRNGSLSLDLAGRLRNPIADGGPGTGHVQGTIRGGLAIPLPRVASTGESRIQAAVRLVPDTGGAGEEHVLRGDLHATPQGARLEVSSTESLPNGTYELTFATGEYGAWLGRRAVKVQGDSLSILRHSPSAPAPASAVWKGRVKRMRKRGRAVLREVYRRVRR
ncbi:glycosyltransferase family 2 protein [Amnibacterium endophyticum]|uniref:Glycosyltransferase family 2 protein n=1 Tax=Amnibacterium endophyticum TaxID=2109337 RepID=A0ABW4LC84_9MICO